MPEETKPEETKPAADIASIIQALRAGATEAIGAKTGADADIVLVLVQASDILKLCAAAQKTSSE
jgi:hypothetical protein